MSEGQPARRRRGDVAALVVLGVVLWIAAGLLATYGNGGPGVLVIALLGAALLAGGLILRARQS